MEFEFSFNGFPKNKHYYVYSGLSCWSNIEQQVKVDFKNCSYDLHEWVDDTVADILVYHINLACVHGLIDQHMFYGECKNEGWDPLYSWNIKLILGMGMGDLGMQKFDEIFEYDKNMGYGLFVETDFRTGESYIPFEYHSKDKNAKRRKVTRSLLRKLKIPM